MTDHTDYTTIKEKLIRIMAWQFQKMLLESDFYIPKKRLISLAWNDFMHLN